MALGRLITEVKDVLNGSAVPTLGQTGTLKIDRRSNLRLETILVHVNCTLASVVSWQASRNGLEAIAKEIRLSVSDQAGSSRPLIKAPSHFLINYHKDREGKLDRYTQAAYGRNGTSIPANGTYDIFIPLHIKPPGMNEAIASIFSLPLQDRIGKAGDTLGVSDDPRLEVQIADNNAALGLNSATFTMNYVKAQLIMREMAPAVPYAPAALEWSEQNAFTSTAETEISIPSTGHLLNFSIDEFASATARGTALDTTVATLGYWKLKYGRTILREWLSKQQIARNGHWMQEYPDGNTAAFALDRNTQFMHTVDLLHDTTLGEAFSGASTLNLYTENRGDSAKLVATRPVSGASIGLGTYKLFAPIEVLNGI